jgi:DNA-binding CsgD family transcriptional regulator
LLRQAIAEAQGVEVKSLGDGLMVVFGSAVDALHCAVDMQRRINGHNEAGTAPRLAVRVGVHAGEPLRDGGDFHGEAVVTASRLCSEADGAQILASELVAGLVGSRGGFRFRPAGRLRLKGLPEPVAAVTVEWREPEPAAAEPDEVRRPAASRRSANPSPAGPRGPRLVGRDRELAALEEEFAAAAAGEFRSVLLIGDGGVGKTRLAQELAARHGGGVVTLSARAYPLGATTAFGVWTEALERHLRGLDRDEVERVTFGAADDLAGLLRSVRAVGGPRAGAGDEPPRSRLLEAFAVVLSNLARDGPVVMLLDDLHLADASSLELLHYLAHGCAGEPILVLATARPVELADRREAAAVVSRLEQDELLRRLVLEPLDTGALAGLTEAVTGARATPVLVEWVERRTRGNPLYTIGLLRALVEEGADLSAPVLRRIPEGLAERVVSRFRELDETAQRTIELLAVLGRRVDSRTLVGLSTDTPDDLVDTLDRLTQMQGITAEERGHELTYEITHPLVAEAVYQGIGAGRRRRLHRDVARRLLAAGRLAEAAPHFVASADPGDDEAVGVLREAVRAAEDAESYQEALTILNSLVDLLPAGDPRWAEVVDALSWEAQWVVNHRADTHAVVGIPALRAMDHALAAVDDPTRRAVVKLRLATFLGWGTGELDEARRVCREAQQLFDDAADRRGALLARHELAWIDFLSGNATGLEEGARHVVDEAEAIGDDMVRSRALSSLVGAMVTRCRLREVEAPLQEILAAGRAEGNPHRQYMALYYAGITAAVQGRVDEARAVAKEATAVTARLETRPRLELEFLVAQIGGDHRWALGRARELALMAGEVSRQGALAYSVAAVAATEAGEFGEARRYLSRATAAYGGRDWGFQSQWACYASAVLAWREGRPGEAVPSLRRVVARIVEMDGWAVGVPAFVDLAEVGGRLGEVERAAVDGLTAVSERTGLDSHRALAALAAGWAAFAAGHRQAAEAHAARAVELLTGVCWPLYLGQAQALLGLVSDDRTRAVTALRSAADLLEANGALVRRSEVLDALGRLGSAGKRAAAAVSGPGSLTARERDVAALAAAGLSAKEIGERLFIGERTVESHLARAYAKLGVRSKVELAGRAAELGLDQSS